MLVPLVLLAAPVVAAGLFWGRWAGFAAAVLVAAVQLQALRQTEQFSDRIWRVVGRGRRARRARGADALYVASAVAGVVLLVVALLTA